MSGTRSIAQISISLREVPILKRDVIVENHFLLQLSPFDVRSG